MTAPVLTDAQRDKMLDSADFLYRNRGMLGYAQIRPAPIYSRVELAGKFKAGTPVNVWDCSASMVMICHLAGLKDPTGFGYSGVLHQILGNTESIAGFLNKHYTNPENAHLGALVVIGLNLPLGSQHVVMVTVPGKDPEVWSHGMPGVRKLPLSSEMTAHPGASATFCDVNKLA